MNENLEKGNNLTPDGDDNAAKAFKWELEEGEAEKQSVEAEAQTAEPCEETEQGEETEQTSAEEPTECDGSAKSAESTEEIVQTSPKKSEIKAKKREERYKRRYSTRTLVKESNLAIILASVAIVLLVAMTALIAIGIIPIDSRVVFVHTSSFGPVATAPYDASPELIEEVKSSVVLITVKRESSIGTGSGIIISEDGYIVTNCHVIEDTLNIKVSFYNSDKNMTARVIGYSKRDDIAVIKVDAEGLRPATFASSADCRTGERVYSIGAPEGEEFAWSVAQGIISNPQREIKIYNDEYILEKKMYLLQTDTAVNPGNSGGPLINARGEVVGIVTLKRTDAAGLGFALPSSESLELIEAIIENGNIDGVTSKISRGRPLIGIVGAGIEADVWYEDVGEQLRNVNDSYAATYPDKCFKSDVAGVYVTSLNPELDAYNHLKVGDVITKVNGYKVSITYDIMDIVNEYNGGDAVTVTFVRDGETLTANIILEEEK